MVRPVIVVRDRYPDWSPDGTRIVFDSTRTGAQEIFVLDVDDATPKQLTQLGRRSATPVFSPDGESLVFNRDYFKNEEDEATWIYVTRVDRPVHELMKADCDVRPPLATSAEQKSKPSVIKVRQIRS